MNPKTDSTASGYSNDREKFVAACLISLGILLNPSTLRGVVGTIRETPRCPVFSYCAFIRPAGRLQRRADYPGHRPRRPRAR